jgi:hypothetical protein
MAVTAISGVLVKSLVDAASRVEELSNKFDTVFKGIEQEANSWAKEYARATSRGVTSTKEFLATQQDIRTGYGDNVQAAYQFSKAVVATTNDLASFSNVPIEEAMAAMQSGLAYQFEALRRLGVSISVATISQSSYAQSIGKTWDEMDNLQKQEAILSAIMEQSPNALHQNIALWTDYNYRLGDAATTSGSFANSSQGLKQSFDDLKAELGDALLPMMTKLSQHGIEAIEQFESWSDGAQTATVAAGAFALALAALGGPLGIITGALGAGAILLSSHKTSTEKLSAATQNLKDITGEYNDIVSKLNGNTKNLSATELALLNVRQEVAASKALTQLQEVKDTINKNNEALESDKQRLSASLGAFNAYNLAKEEGASGVYRRLANLDRDNLTDQQQHEKSVLTQITTYYQMWGDDSEKAVKEISQQLTTYATKVESVSATVGETENQHKETIIAIAQLYNAKIPTIVSALNLYKVTDKALYDEIMAMAAALSTGAQAQDDNSAATQEAIYQSKSWRQELEQQNADLLEAQKQYKAAADIKIKLLDQEQEAAIQKLASDAGLIKSGEDVTTLSNEELRKRIEGNSGANAELAALDQFYANKRREINKEADDAVAADQKEAFDKQIEEAQAAYEKQQELQNKRKENASQIATMLRQQSDASRESAASELENAGHYEEAYAIRIQLIGEEQQRAVAAMQEKVKANEATLQDITDLNKYYNNEVTQLNEQKDDAIKQSAEKRAQAEKDAAQVAKAADERALEERKQAAKQYYETLKNNLLDFLSAYVSYMDAQTSAQEDAIDAQTKAQEEALGIQEETTQQKLQREYEEAVAAGDMETAQEKQQALQRQQIEDEAEEKKKKLEREQAEREKKLNIFQATINGLTAVVKYLSDPGGYAGIALSAMAAGMTAMQIAAIQAEPLPSYDVGAEKILEDQIAVVHKGETILPEPMAEAVRNGDATYGASGSNVTVEINNYTGAETSQSESTDNAGNKKMIITIGKVVGQQISEGAYDTNLMTRYNINRKGYNA